MKLTKRFLSILLTCALLCGILPWEHVNFVSADSIYDYRYFSTDGKVTITGYDGNGGKIVIPDIIEGMPVVCIGEYAFSYCTALTSIVIPDSVISIGGSAFAGCSTLTSIAIPDSVTSIGDSAFIHCSSLTSIILPSGLETFDGVFLNCASLKSIVIPSCVTHISTWTFLGCTSLESITFESPNTEIFNNSATLPASAVIYGHEDSTAQAYAIEHGRTFIAFHNHEWESVTVPPTCEKDGSLRRYCDLCGKTSEEILPAIGHKYGEWQNAAPGKEVRVCKNCGKTENRDNILGYEYIIENGKVTITKYIGTGSDVVIPSAIEGLPVVCIGDEAFYEYWALERVTLPDTITCIGDEAFHSCGALASIVIPDGVTSIGREAFRGCGLGNVIIPVSVNSIGQKAFSLCRDLASITFKSSATEIYDSNSTIFETAVIYGYAGSTAEAYAEKYGKKFMVLDSLETDDHKDFVYTIEEGKVTIISYKGAGGDVVIPSTIEGLPVVSVGDWAFNFCHTLTSIVIPDGVTSIGREAFYNCSFLTSVSIPDGVTSIGEKAFYSCSDLTDIAIPDSVTSIGDSAFYSCSSLPSIVIPDGVTSIGDRTFSSCSRLTNIVIPDSVTSIGSHAFSICYSLTSVVIPDSVTSIGEEAFYGCSSLKSIVIPDSVTSIGNAAFSCGENFTSITFESLTTEIYDRAHTISETAVIYGHAGSTAEAYAIKYGRIFVEISSSGADTDESYDVDGDGEITESDVENLLSLLLGNTETDDLLRFDFDGDGVLTIFDCVLLLQKATS